MYVESVTLRNFQCFGSIATTIDLDPQLTVLIGTNGTGKTAVFEAMLRLFGVTSSDRDVRVDDFHVPAAETEAPESRSFTIETVLAFPELDDDEHGLETVPEFFHQMAATHDGKLKCRIVLEASWIDDGSVDGTITAERRVVYTFDTDYGDQWVALSVADRSRIQMIYVPASRDGAQQVSKFLRGRLWRASQWTDDLRDLVTSTADKLAKNFNTEPVVRTVEDTLTRRWQQLQTAGSDTVPGFQPIDSDLFEIVRNAELLFTPSPTGQPRRARFLSDGQRSLLHLALSATALDIENALADGAHHTEFDVASVQPPALTLLAVEEPENSLAPFYLARIVEQILDLCDGPRAQGFTSSHSASVLGRIEPERVRYFRVDTAARTTTVRPILLPAEGTEAGKYIREAVRAHPELYFARFVVLGEGDLEELVIPLIAQARGVAIDRSFVAMVPLGGRHTNHFWRLLSDLKIPHATLLDFDLGRAGGGAGRIRDVCRRLIDIGIDPFERIDGYDDLTDLEGDLTPSERTAWRSHLRQWNVFFSTPLDLDMALLRKFWSHYTRLVGRESGPRNDDATDTVLGVEGGKSKYWNPTDAKLLERRKDQLRWYRYRFLGRSKPGTHLRVLSTMTTDDLKAPPEPLAALIDCIAKEVGQ
ncbi:ATP-dependent nuclease [Nocardia amamiensis]|uniref:ATP-dependent nuclease n=1 Tax=Nocardia amamiensis TaxID=404578 RepID=UPI0008348859|nr:AAA family ATPase [Nocardia amamiensis]